MGRDVGAVLLCLLLMAGGCTDGGSEAGDEGVAEPDAPAVQPTSEPTVTGSPSAGLTVDGSPAAEPDSDTADTSTDAWRALAPAPLALSEVAGAGHAGEVWTAGGLTADGQGSRTVQRYTPRADGWLPGPDLPVAVHHSSLVSTGGRLYLLGGYEGSDFSTPTDAVWVLEDEIAGWVPGPPLPAARAAGAGAFDGTDLVYGGGVAPEGVASDVWRLDDGGWTPIGLLSTPREHLSAAGSDGVVWFMGGRVRGLDSNLGRVDVVRDGAVATLGDVLPPSGGVAGFATGDGRGCMVGGEDPVVALAAVVCVDAEGTASELPSLGLARHGLAVATVDGMVYAAMGGPEPGLFVSDVIEALPLPER